MEGHKGALNPSILGQTCTGERPSGSTYRDFCKPGFLQAADLECSPTLKQRCDSVAGRISPGNVFLVCGVW